MDGRWNFLLGWLMFRGKLLVSGRVQLTTSSSSSSSDVCKDGYLHMDLEHDMFATAFLHALQLFLMPSGMSSNAKSRWRCLHQWNGVRRLWEECITTARMMEKVPRIFSEMVVNSGDFYHGSIRVLHHLKTNKSKMRLRQGSFCNGRIPI